MIFPRQARPDPVIGIVATGSKPPLKRLQDGIAKLNKLGFTTIDYTNFTGGHFTDNHRLKSLNRAFSNPRVDIVMAVRGGYGNLRIVDKIDYDLIAESKKILIGFSDLTALSIALFTRKKMLTFSGPMVVTNFFNGMPSLTRLSFMSHINGSLSSGYTIDLKNLGGINYRRGSVQGRLLGGNMAILSRLIGTQYCPDFKNSILFLEDVDEHPRRLENMFMHYRMAGIFDKINGLILGKFTDCFKGKPKIQPEKVKALLDDTLAGYKFPLIYNLPFGHEDKIITLPVGLKVELNTNKSTLTYLESPVK